MKYLVLEIQTSAGGTVGIPPIASFDTLREAQARYYAILSAAAASSLPLHCAAIMDNTGRLIERQSFEIPQEIEDSAPEETASENAMGG